MRLFFSVGEPSGDVHGANLIRALAQRARAHGEPTPITFGFGGPKMAAAGCDVRLDLTRNAIMGLGRSIAAVPRMFGHAVRADRLLQRERPDAVILVDFPGFNWWIARRAKRHRIPVLYYSPPQIWAWARWRVNKMRRLIDHSLCGLPFEEKFLNDHGCRATYVGHPFFDEVARHQLDETFIAEQRAKPGRLVSLLPGSRTHEVTSNLSYQLAAARRIHAAVPDVRFAIACHRDKHAAYARRLIAEQASDLPIGLHVGRTPELMHLAACSVTVSGSVSLELLHHETPTVIVFHMTRFQEWFGRQILHSKYITLVNLLADPVLDDLRPRARGPVNRADPNVPYPEYWSAQDCSARAADHVIEWLTHESSRQRVINQLRDLKARYAQPGAAQKAAEVIARVAQAEATRRQPMPHFTPSPREHRAA